MDMKSNRKAVEKAIRADIIEKLHLCAVPLTRAIKAGTPVRTGKLQRSIMAEVDSSESKLTVGSPVHYAGYVEGGTSKMAANPYLRRGLMKSLSSIKKIFRGR